MPRPPPNATKYGYAVQFVNVVCLTDFEFVYVEQITKSKDLVWSEDSGMWYALPESYVDCQIKDTWRPIIRPMLWVCGHARERREKCCPICIIFHKNVDERY